MLGAQMEANFKVDVFTSNDGGLSAEELTDLCVRKLVSVSETASPQVQAQAKIFQDQVRHLVHFYIKRAMGSERDRCVQELIKGGELNAAALLKR